jgi:hypothetical protein
MIDAFWSESTLGSKLKSKIVERIERIKKLTKPPLHLGKNLNKTLKLQRHESNKVLVIQQTSKVAKKMFDRKSSEKSIKTMRVLSRRLSRQLEPPDSISAFSTTNELNISATLTERTKPTGGMSRYNSLREQLSKITLEVFANENADKVSILQRQRRTRKERIKKSINAEVTKKPPLMDLNKTQYMKKLSRCNVRGIATVRGSIKTSKTFTETANNSVRLKTNVKTKQLPNKKLNDYNSRIARKHLNELYAKILFKVRDMEKEKRVLSKVTKKTLGKCASLRTNSFRTSKPPLTKKIPT